MTALWYRNQLVNMTLHGEGTTLITTGTTLCALAALKLNCIWYTLNNLTGIWDRLQEGDNVSYCFNQTGYYEYVGGSD